MNYFKNVPTLDLREVDTIHKFGITSDIISYRLCPRSYGYFKARNFTPSSAGQLFFGTVLHEVFDQAHLHYSGKINLGELKIKTKNKNNAPEIVIERMKEILQELVEEGVLDSNQIKDSYENESHIPTPLQLGTAFINVENALKARGITHLSGGLRDRAFKLTQIFNEKLGNFVYPKIIDTEQRLQHIGITAKNNKYIMEGVVDLLVNEEEKKISKKDINYETVEIWDYKGANKEKLTKSQLESYKYQMQTYSKLFMQKYSLNSVKSAKLVMIGSIDKKEVLDEKDPQTVLDKISIPICELTQENLDTAYKEFEKTMDEIINEKTKPYQDQWQPYKVKDLKDHPTPKTTCETCELRWSCKNPNGKFVIKNLTNK